MMTIDEKRNIENFKSTLASCGVVYLTVILLAYIFNMNQSQADVSCLIGWLSVSYKELGIFLNESMMKLNQYYEEAKLLIN